MKKSECEFELESLSSSHCGDNFLNIFSLQVYGFTAMMLLLCFACSRIVVWLMVIIPFIG